MVYTNATHTVILRNTDPTENGDKLVCFYSGTTALYILGLNKLLTTVK